jgi:hypothetical protein
MANQNKTEDKIVDFMEQKYGNKDKLFEEKNIVFDPDGSEYDEETGQELREIWPLTMSKPDRPGHYDEETVDQDEWAFQSWVWHKNKNDWVKHDGTLDPRTGMFLKGMAKNALKDSDAYISMAKGIKEEIRLGNSVVQEDRGRGMRYYSIRNE